jgi:hypothetical protein
MSEVGKAAIERDKAWFRANPIKTRMTRRVHREELPLALRNLGIVSVFIERAGPSQFTRTFFNRYGRAAACGMDTYDAPIVPDAPAGVITLYLEEDTSFDAPLTLASQSTKHRRVRGITVDAGTAARDREWFEQHPGQTSYTRPMTAEELLLLVETPSGFVAVSGTMRVTRVGKGTRTREGFDILIEPAKTQV